MSGVIIDTNVPIVANGQNEAAGVDCIAECTQALRQAREGAVLVDAGYEMFAEYRRHLRHAGQPGLGDAFFKWLWDNQANAAHCRQVPITRRANPPRWYEEFPDDPALVAFDPSDQKFVAVALASGGDPPILNASDSDWWHARAALEAHGIRITFLCPALMPGVV